MREELIKFDRYQKQFKFLYENRIETVGKLITYYKETESKISEIIEMKREIYSHRTEENDNEVNEKIRIMNNKLRKLRNELCLCKNIYADSQLISRNRSRVSELIKQAEMEESENEHKRRSR